MRNFFKRLLVQVFVLPVLCTSAFAGRAVMEGISASNSAVLVDTTNARVQVGSGGIRFNDSTIQTTAATSATVAYASATITADQTINNGVTGFITSSSVTLTGIHSGNIVECDASLEISMAGGVQANLWFTVDSVSQATGGIPANGSWIGLGTSGQTTRTLWNFRASSSTHVIAMQAHAVGGSVSVNVSSGHRGIVRCMEIKTS